MNLLLLLSALLSALTGVSNGVRVEAPQTLSQTRVDTAPAVAVTATAAVRPVQPLATLVAVAMATTRSAVPAPNAAIARLLTNRRRE